MFPADQPSPEDPGSPQRLTPEAVAFARGMVDRAMRAEHAAAWKSAQSRTTAAEVLADLEDAEFTVTYLQQPTSPRIWLMPHLFADVLVITPQGATLRVKSKDVRAMWKWVRENGMA